MEITDAIVDLPFGSVAAFYVGIRSLGCIIRVNGEKYYVAILTLPLIKQYYGLFSSEFPATNLADIHDALPQIKGYACRQRKISQTTQS